jgi:hypothetical protein
MNFRVPPFLRVISEIMIFLRFNNWRGYWILRLISIVFFSCYYSLNFYNIRSHGKRRFIVLGFIIRIREIINLFFYLLFIILFLTNINFLFSGCSIFLCIEFKLQRLITSLTF